MKMRCSICDEYISEYDYCGKCLKLLLYNKYIWCNYDEERNGYDEENQHFCSARCMRRYYAKVINQSKATLNYN